jgi:poly-gamma-glutamate capsule biosynthesis protein CapA/YwtB (metallophosphatase superfamily)
MPRNLAIVIIALITFSYSSAQQNEGSIKLLFIGDIMGHDTQIESAYNSETETYNYNDVFLPLKPIFDKADFTIANLEVTLAGKPHSGYPQFSSPDELAIACKANGIDALVTSNNHSCDRGLIGITRTVDILDSLGIKHTGTFRNQQDRDSLNLMVLEKNGIRIGILNYTYGTNGLPIPEPSIVNTIDLIQIKTDLIRSKRRNLDKLIVFMHWGIEYQLSPNQNQDDVANFLFEEGVDVIIGSHPHVLQKMDYFSKSENMKERIVVYSLGNFVSNQRRRGTDGGAMFEVTFAKNNGEVGIADKGYYLTWVDKKFVKGKVKYEILPAKFKEDNSFEGMTKAAEVKMKTFLDDSRERFNSENANISEIEYTID